MNSKVRIARILQILPVQLPTDVINKKKKLVNAESMFHTDEKTPPNSGVWFDKRGIDPQYFQPAWLCVIYVAQNESIKGKIIQRYARTN